MYSDESARTAKTAHSPIRELAVAPVPARRIANDSETQLGCKNPPADFLAAVAPPHTEAYPSADLSAPLASSAQTAAYPARAAQFPQLASSFQNNSASPTPWPQPIPLTTTHPKTRRTPLSTSDS